MIEGRLGFVSAICFFVSCLNASGAATLPSPVPTSHLSADLRLAASALGDRLETPGKERAILTGMLTVRGKVSPVTVTTELPFSINVLFGDSQPTIAFDGKKLTVASSNAVIQDQLDIVETLLGDLGESLLAGISDGRSGFRTLARRARYTGGSVTGFTGTQLNIYEAVVTLPGTTTTRDKFYYFDSNTSLPAFVLYKNSTSSVDVRTEFSKWIKVAGQQVPGQIIRFEAGAQVILLQISAVSFVPKSSDGKFAFN